MELNLLVLKHTKITDRTSRKLSQLLNYCAIHLDAAIEFLISNMILYASLDAFYLSDNEGIIHEGG